MQKMEQMELQAWAIKLWAEIAQKKLQTVKKMARVKAMFGQSKKIDETQYYMEYLNEVVAAERANLVCWLS